MLGGPRIVAPSVIMQNAPAVADLPDHPAEPWSDSCEKPRTRRTVQLPLTSPAARME
jgi:hypothetical protein